LNLDWDTDLIRPHLLTEMGDQDIVRSLKMLRQTFTVSREGLEDYTRDIRLVMSYALVYAPTNIPKFHFLMQHLGCEEKSQLLGSTFIDLGTGPGTYLLAFLEACGEGNKQVHYGIDSSETMLEQAEAICRGIFPKRKTVFQKQLPRIEGPTTLCFGNSLNEMSVEAAFSIIKKVEPSYLIFIEPGTPEVFKKLMQLRGHLKNDQFEGLYPCPSGLSNCPMLEIEGEWCHQVLRMIHRPGVERLCQMAQMDRKIQPFTGHIYKRGTAVRKELGARFIRFKGENKHAFDWQVCLGAPHQVLDFEIPKKSLSKREQKEFKKLSVGLGVNYKVIKKLSDTKWRVEITQLADEK
jgi:hypothetical protein